MAGRLSRDEAWRLTGLILLACALIWRSAPLAVLGAGLFLAALTVTLWGRYALRGVAYRRRLSEGRAAFGETVTLTVEIDNRKPLPLPWLEANDSFPDALEVVERRLLRQWGTGRVLLRQVVSLGWYERLRLLYRVRCRARGAFTLGPVRLAGGDPFGFAVRETHLPALDRLLVYPNVLPLEALGLPARHPFGDAPDRRRLFDDPARLAGVRPYVTSDSPRHIHWKASARLQGLHTRVYEPTTRHTLMLYLNLASFEGYWWAALNRELLELTIVTAASVACWGLEQGYHVGLATNGAPAGVEAAGGHEIGLAPAANAQQRVRLLEALARVSQLARTPLERLIGRDRTRLPWGTTVVVVSAVIPESVQEAMHALRRSGHTPVAIRIGGVASDPPGVLTYRVPDTLAWADAPALAISGAAGQ